jgi:hypothetical protein
MSSSIATWRAVSAKWFTTSSLEGGVLPNLEVPPRKQDGPLPPLVN